MKDLDNIVIDGLDENYATNADIDEIESASVMLADMIIDGSGSMDPYETIMQDCLEHSKSAIANSKQADEMLVSKSIFSNTIITGGYVVPDDFDTSYSTYGMTRLYDAIIERRQRLLDYMEQLKNNGTNVRACMVIFSDGQDNASRNSIGDARQAIQDLISKEITVAFVAFGDEAKGIASSLGIKPNNTKEVDNNESELRRIMDLVSKSAISASKKASAGVTDDGGFFDI